MASSTSLSRSGDSSAFAGTFSVRCAVAQHALRYLEGRKNIVTKPSNSTLAGNGTKPGSVLESLPKYLHEWDATDTALLAQLYLLNSPMVLTGSNALKHFVTFKDAEAVSRLLPKAQAALLPPRQPKKGKTIAGSGTRTKLCRTPGCGRPLAVTSSSYCSEHVGSVELCTVKDCSRVVEGIEGSRRYCRKHLLELRDKQSSTAAAATTASSSSSSSSAARGAGTMVQPVIIRAQPVAAPAEYEIPKGAIKRCLFDGCNKTSRGATWFCIQHGGGKRCQFINCSRSARGATSFCVTHGGGRRCSVALCTKSAVGATQFCIAHGGGKRCKYPECTHSAEGGTSFCIRHGGGRRCKTPDCNKSAVGTTDYCVACGGGKRCSEPGCQKSAVGSTSLCKAHGGGRRCTHPSGCTKSAQGASFLCIVHGGGKRCASEGCTVLISSGGSGDFCKKHGSTGQSAPHEQETNGAETGKQKTKTSSAAKKAKLSASVVE